jgi:hypothetical protein
MNMNILTTSADIKIYLDGKRLGWVQSMTVSATAENGLIKAYIVQAKPKKGASSMLAGIPANTHIEAALVSWKGKVIRLMTTNATSLAELQGTPE